MTRAFICVLIALPHLIWSQQQISGTLRDADSKLGLSDVIVAINTLELVTVTDKDGAFNLSDVPAGTHELSFTGAQFVLLKMEIEVTDRNLNLGTVELVPESGATDEGNPEDYIPTITLSDEDLEQETDNQNISGILSASRDVFVSAAAFTFGPMRFRIRGYDSENTELIFNGVPMNDLESGRLFWSAWGGLNDVTRNRDTDVGLFEIPYTFGGVGGATSVDTRASMQRKQVRLSASVSNRSYQYRLMGTYSTGMMSNGWAISASASRRWADEGYIEGTFYDGYSYFLSVDRKLGDNHMLNFTGFGAPTRRGRSAASTQEMYDIAGSNYYNPNWGYQNGEKRNARVAEQHQPIFILRHDWTLTNKATITTAVSYQTGRNGSTALDWFDAPDPRPDYYRYLPSFFERNDEDQAASIITERLQDENNRQLNWAEMYEANELSSLTDKFDYLLGEGAPAGKWSQYIIEDRRYDNTRANFYSNYQHAINENFALHAGLSYQYQKVENFREVVDLLGGDFYVNVDRFAIRDSISNLDAQQNNLENPSEILRVGDRLGHDYETHVQKGNAWVQGLFTLRKVDFFLGASLTNTRFWRQGNFRNGRFPDNSFGKSEVQNFTNYAAKGGLTYKINGRNYLYANGMYQTRAPFYRNAYISPRTRDQLLPNLTDETIYGGEAGYIVRAPKIKARFTGYYTQFQDQVRVLRFYSDFSRAFGNYILSGVDKQHLGAEVAIEAKISPRFTLSGVAAIGEYQYNSRQTGNIFLDNVEDLSRDTEDFTIYTKNLHIAGMPQRAYTFGINYNDPKYWFANLNFNYFDRVWIDFSPERRIAENLIGIDPASDQYRSIVEQELSNSAFTLDFFGGKSFKFGRNFLYLNLGVSNILDKQDFRTGGFEQLRFDARDRDVNAFPSRYYYSFGRNYFFNISYRY